MAADPRPVRPATRRRVRPASHPILDADLGAAVDRALRVLAADPAAPARGRQLAADLLRGDPPRPNARRSSG